MPPPRSPDPEVDASTATPTQAVGSAGHASETVVSGDAPSPLVQKLLDAVNRNPQGIEAATKAVVEKGPLVVVEAVRGIVPVFARPEAPVLCSALTAVTEIAEREKKNAASGEALQSLRAEVLPVIIRHLGADDPDVRLAATRAVCRIDARNADVGRHALDRLLSTPTNALQASLACFYYAARAAYSLVHEGDFQPLVRLCDPAVVPILCAAIRGGELTDRCRAADIAGNLCVGGQWVPSELLDALIDTLRDDRDNQPRCDAAKALSKIGPAAYKAVPLLAQLKASLRPTGQPPPSDLHTQVSIALEYIAPALGRQDELIQTPSHATLVSSHQLGLPTEHPSPPAPDGLLMELRERLAEQDRTIAALQQAVADLTRTFLSVQPPVVGALPREAGTEVQPTAAAPSSDVEERLARLEALLIAKLAKPPAPAVSDGLLVELRQRLGEQESTIAAIQQAMAELPRTLLAPQPSAAIPQSRETGGEGTATASPSPDIEERLARLEALLAPKDNKPSALRAELKPKEREVLQAILDLPNDAFVEAGQLLEALDGEPMTEAFAKSLSAVLARKDWSVKCDKCGAKASIYWQSNNRMTLGGIARFGHAGVNGTTKHQSISRIRKLSFLKKIDRRRT